MIIVPILIIDGSSSKESKIINSNSTRPIMIIVSILIIEEG